MYEAIYPIPALKDNYIWAIIHSQTALIIDPGEAQPVIDFLTAKKFTLKGILATHHHWDHTNGIDELKERYQPVIHLPSDPTCPIEGIEIIRIPGHTLDHTAYLVGNNLFCGDTLFTGGCGRLFEGTAEMMFHSLQTLAQLSAETMIYCGHEYTEKNLQFAQCVEPSNIALQKRITTVKNLRADGQPTVPASLREELLTNPFLRCHEPEVIASASAYAKHSLQSPLEVFTVLRKWKDQF